MSKRSAATRWRSGHGTKIVHRWWLGAVWHSIRVTSFRWRTNRRFYLPYRCKWGQWYYNGQTAPVHWHVGRRSTRRRR